MKKIKTFTLAETRFLSNFYPHKQDGTMYSHLVSVIYNGIVFDCVENAYQAAKSLDVALQLEMSKMSPYDTKSYWDNRKDEIRPDWSKVKFEIMKELVEQKFVGSRELSNLLLQTGEALLEEGNDWVDVYWGIDIETGNGENNLGKILMLVREKLKK